MMRKLLIVLALTGAATAANAAPQTIVLEKPEVRASLGKTPTTAAYLTIRNKGAVPDRLVGVTCVCAASVSAHSTITTNGVARMTTDRAVVIPAGGAVTFAPGGRHLMLMGMKRQIKAGDKVVMALRFEKAGDLTMTFAATDTPGAAGMAGMDHSHH